MDNKNDKDPDRSTDDIHREITNNFEESTVEIPDDRVVNFKRSTSTSSAELYE